METKIKDGDEKVTLLEEWLSEAQDKREIDDRKKRMNFEMEIYEAKMKLQAEHLKPQPKEPMSSDTTFSKLQVRLPKMTITLLQYSMDRMETGRDFGDNFLRLFIKQVYHQ